MKYNQINPTLQLFKAIACLEDDVKLQQDKKDQPATAVAKIKTAMAEKRALVQRTHKAKIEVTLDYTTKPFVLSAEDTYDVLWSQETDAVVFVESIRAASDGTACYPAATHLFSFDKILDIHVKDFDEAAMAAVSNQALAARPSANAEKIVNLLDLKALVEGVKAAANVSDSVGSSSLQVMWFPVSGWGPIATTAFGANPDLPAPVADLGDRGDLDYDDALLLSYPIPSLGAAPASTTTRG